MITKYVIALGSNINSDWAFAIALLELGGLGDIRLSSRIIGQDFTGKTELIYHNAVAVLLLDEPCEYDGFNEYLKNIEKKCGRTAKQPVPMDLDILAYHDNKNWQIMNQRLPFKEHEKKGLTEVAPFLL